MPASKKKLEIVNQAMDIAGLIPGTNALVRRYVVHDRRERSAPGDGIINDAQYDVAI